MPESMTTVVRQWLLRFEEEHHHEIDAAEEAALSRVRALISRYPEPDGNRHEHADGTKHSHRFGTVPHIHDPATGNVIPDPPEK
jgi:hypothetical protein